MQEDKDAPVLTRYSSVALRWAEDAIYLGVGVLLSLGGVALLVRAVIVLVGAMSADVEDGVKAMLDLLLLVFILVELLSAVRTTVRQRKLVAEPFLIVGMIATIKEVVVATIDAKDLRGAPEFADAMLEIGILSGLLIALAIASFLTRRKEREPEE